MFRGLGLEDPGLGLEGWSHGFEDPGLVLEGWSHGFEDPGLGLKGWGLGLKTLALTTSVTVTCPRLADGVSEACSRRLELRRLGCIHVGGTGISWIFGRPDLLKAKIKFSTFDAVLLAQVSRLSFDNTATHLDVVLDGQLSRWLLSSAHVSTTYVSWSQSRAPWLERLYILLYRLLITVGSTTATLRWLEWPKCIFKNFSLCRTWLFVWCLECAEVNTSAQFLKIYTGTLATDSFRSALKTHLFAALRDD